MTLISSGRIPPQCIDIEEYILSSSINDADAASTACRKCTEDMFYKESHRIIFRAIKELFYARSTIDYLLLIQQLKKMESLELIGGAYTVTNLSNGTSGSNIDWHIAILWQTWQKRKIIELGSNYIDKAFDDSTDAIDLILSLYADLDDIKNTFESSKQITIANVVDTALDNILLRATGEIPSYLRTGYNKLDSIAKIDIDKIVIIAGDKKHLKTRFMISIIMGLLKNYFERLSVLWYSLEDNIETLLNVILSYLTFIPSDELKSEKGYLSEEKYELIKRMSKLIKSWDVEYRDETKPIKLISADFASFCKKRPGRANVLIIDNALYIDNKEDKRDDLIIDELVKLRKATKGLIFLVHHFNSEYSKREHIKTAYRPEIGDIKGREAYGRGADLILLVNKLGNWNALKDEYPGMEDIINYLYLVDIAANRHGKANQDELTLLRFWAYPNLMQFEEI